ncbi:MAG: DUF2628 domain-containing protein, partial [Clostridia bacterium]|nr:DUF2628 domain-containing protein [Clostridia bacterium]
MSAYFNGKRCSVCGLSFGENDDVVACPECGAPYHRECWPGQCVFQDKHGTDEQWQNEEETVKEEPVEYFETNKQDDSSQNGNAVTCFRCGRINFPAGEKCAFCGNPLNKEENKQPFGETIGGYSFIIDPLGGVDPNEDIDGVAAGEVAQFVVSNTTRYVPKFSKMSKTKNAFSWNWAAFLFPGYWFLYRKCYVQGIFVLLMSVVSELLATPFTQSVMDIVSQYENYQDAIKYISTNIDILSIPQYLMYLASLALTFGIMLICGIFGDAIYKKHCISKIKDINSGKVKNNFNLPAAFLKAKKGGVSFFSPIVGYTLY